ncbi:hypothetical protein Bca52824_010039 [Brassica carinata]|uniref:Uncharacterized protein n=1 Tax=Brassica carinata TaxID=52824 RepID=A0A8X7WD70_BRACI|nr:hypothetical protein Bca52824_010039 [Brassica carinata]
MQVQYPPQPEVEFGFPQVCYCGAQPRLRNSRIDTGDDADANPGLQPPPDVDPSLVARSMSARVGNWAPLLLLDRSDLRMTRPSSSSTRETQQGIKSQSSISGGLCFLDMKGTAQDLK